jgi:putative ubiquitin-RnfH superfamily antitoxin RatB of RatAB toxin-antitoxin module
MNAPDDSIDIEVACATPRRQAVVALRVPRGCTVGEAVERSGLLREFPELPPGELKMGIFGSLRKPEDPVAAGDRVELYRPLIADPKQARRQRAKNKTR